MATLTSAGKIEVSELLSEKKDTEFIHICYNKDKPSRIIKGNGEDITDEVYHDKDTHPVT